MPLHILKPKAEREAMQRLFDPPIRQKRIASGFPYDELERESYQEFKKAHGGGRTVVTMPELPWKQAKV